MKFFCKAEPGSRRSDGTEPAGYMTPKKHISVCVCTFQRPSLLRKLLDRLEHQQSNGQFSFSIVVTDNDSGQSSQRVVADFAASSGVAVKYSCEPQQNIALARNEGY